jgi:hypothetical protein
VRAAQPPPKKGKAAAPATQRYTSGDVDVEMPLGAVQQLPLPVQAAVVASIFAALGLGTWASCTFVGPAIESAAPGFFAFSRATWPLLGATFLAAGVAHFTAHDAFVTMMPTRCAGVFDALPSAFRLRCCVCVCAADAACARVPQWRLGHLVPAWLRLVPRQLDGCVRYCSLRWCCAAFH